MSDLAPVYPPKLKASRVVPHPAKFEEATFKLEVVTQLAPFQISVLIETPPASYPPKLRAAIVVPQPAN